MKEVLKGLSAMNSFYTTIFYKVSMITLENLVKKEILEMAHFMQI